MCTSCSLNLLFCYVKYPTLTNLSNLGKSMRRPIQYDPHAIVFFLLLFVWGVFVASFPGLHVRAGYRGLGTRLEYFVLGHILLLGFTTMTDLNNCGFRGLLCELFVNTDILACEHPRTQKETAYHTCNVRYVHGKHLKSCGEGVCKHWTGLDWTGLEYWNDL